MFTLFIRTVIVYLTVFTVLRLMGKRQISDMQPFDLVITLLIADVASEPISDSAVPLLYGIIPILALFILHRTVASIALKSGRIRKTVCGSPVVMIEKGVVLESSMKAAKYSVEDLAEQLRIKDVFSLSQVEYAILETNGSLSVLPKNEQPEMKTVRPSVALITDGRISSESLKMLGYSEKWLNDKLKSIGLSSVRDCLFAHLEPDGMLHVQEKQRTEETPRVHYIKVVNR